jgi:hypothetical protein
MHPNPHKFLSFIFSLVPGAGHMYIGLMKRGASLMIAFFSCIAATVFFGRLPLFSTIFSLSIPVAWFVSFFDFWRYPRMNPDEKSLVEDDFFFGNSKIKLPQGPLMRKVRIVIGILLILAGAQTLYAQFISRYLWVWFNSNNVINFFQSLPSLIGALLIITIGLLLIFWKARQIKQEARYDEE